MRADMEQSVSLAILLDVFHSIYTPSAGDTGNCSCIYICTQNSHAIDIFTFEMLKTPTVGQGKRESLIANNTHLQHKHFFITLHFIKVFNF